MRRDYSALQSVHHSHPKEQSGSGEKVIQVSKMLPTGSVFSTSL